jgi:hypothetical protein
MRATRRINVVSQRRFNIHGILRTLERIVRRLEGFPNPILRTDWYQRIEFHAIRIAVLILLIAALVRLIRADLGL